MCVLLFSMVYALPRPLGFAQLRTLAEDCRLFLISGGLRSCWLFSHPAWSFMERRGGLGFWPSDSCWASRWQSKKDSGEFYPWKWCWPIRKWQVNLCLPNWNVQRCIGFVKPEWRCAWLHEQQAVSPLVSAVSSGINAYIFLPPFLSLFPFSLYSCSHGLHASCSRQALPLALFSRNVALKKYNSIICEIGFLLALTFTLGVQERHLSVFQSDAGFSMSTLSFVSVFVPRLVLPYMLSVLFVFLT